MINLATGPDTAVSGHVLTGLPQVNLLPPELIQRAALRRLQGGLGVVVLGAFVVVGLLAHQASASISSAEQSMSRATAEQGELQAKTARYADVTAAYARTAAVQQLLVDAMSPEVRYSRLLNDLALALPPNVWLTNASWNQPDASTAAAGSTATATGTTASRSLGTVTFTGVADSHDDVAVWLEALSRQKGYTNPYLQTSAEGLIGTRKSVTWSASVGLTPDALSGRYLVAGQ